MRVRQPLTAAGAVMAFGLWLVIMSVVLRDPGTGDTAGSPVPPRAVAPARHDPTWSPEPSGSPTEVGRAPVPGPAPTMVGRTPAPGGLAPYVGTWRAHGSELTIGPDGATEVIRLGPCRGIAAGVDCVSTATLRLDLSKDAPELVYTKFRYTDGTGAAVVPDSLEGLPVAGDGYRLRVFAPGVIELVPLTPHLRQIMGTPYRCAASANEYAHQRLCNA